MQLALTLFVAGLLTILLPCILPLIPIVLGVSVTGRNPWRVPLTVLGMLVSFVGFTFLLQVVLSQLVEVADLLRIATYYALLLFGLGFLTQSKHMQYAGAVIGALFFWNKGIPMMVAAGILGATAMHIGGIVAARIQQLGANVQQASRGALGGESPWTAFVIGLTLGLIWVPCAGPALSLALALVRNEPGVKAAVYLFCYGLGTAVPLLLIGYGGQKAVHGVRAITPYTEMIKKIAGFVLILTALALHLHTFEQLQLWLVEHTSFGDIGTRLEQKLFGDDMEESMFQNDLIDSSATQMLPSLPRLSRAPELNSSGPWHSSSPLTLSELRGKVVLIDFWTYSCINCIRTLPHIQGYAKKFEGKPLVIIGVHTPEFVFEQSEKNVAGAIKRHGLTYPIVQDNNFGTWNAFANRYWPAKYLIDADGYIRYTHFGEGSYDETDKAIRSLLEEIGVTVDSSQTSDIGNNAEGRRNQSPETYLGARSWPALANAQDDPTDATVSYQAPATLALNKYALVGDWQLMDGERQVLQSDTGEIRMRFVGGEANLVLGASDEDPVEAEVFIDGKSTKKFTVDHDDLYNLYHGEHGEFDLVLKVKGKGVEAYAFTFGQ